MEGDKQCYGYPRKRVACCAFLSVLIAAAAITTTVVLLTRPPDDIATIEKSESDSDAATGDFTVTRTASFSSEDSSVVNGTLMFLDATADNSSTLALSDFRIAATDCEGLDIRLLGEASSTSSSAEGLLVVPLTGPANATASDGAADLTEPLGDDFDIELYTQAALWCTTSDGSESQLGSSVQLATPTIESMVVRQATLAGGDRYTTEGMVQILGTVSIVDDAVVTTYSMRFVDIDVSAGPDVFLYLTTDADDPDDVDATGSLTVIVEGAERGTFSFTGNFSQTVPDGFTAPEDYVAAVVWCDQFSVFFGSGLFEDV